MTPVSGVNAGAVQSPAAAGKVQGASGSRRPGEGAQNRPLKPVMDEYVRSEPREPSGRYWMGRGEDGRPQIFFDDPEQGAQAPEQPDAPRKEEPAQGDKGAKGPERRDGEKEERYVCDTGKVDREIKALKKRRQELEQRLRTEKDEAGVKELERQLRQVEQELRQKDNDTYRRRHASVTRLS